MPAATAQAHTTLDPVENMVAHHFRCREGLLSVQGEPQDLSEALEVRALGHTNQKIAEKFFMRVSAEANRAHIMQRLGLSTSAEVVHYGLRARLPLSLP
jgi:DNA-binding NarL/FixJ family response regulator